MKTYAELEADHGPATAELQRWIDVEVRDHGLIDFKVTLGHALRGQPRPAGLTVESLAREIIAMDRAPTVPDPDFF